MIHRDALRKQARALGLTLTRDQMGTYRVHARGSKRRGKAAELPCLRPRDIHAAQLGELAR